MTQCPRDQHLFGPGPKRILSLDGGGVRGIISLAYLERIEAVLAARAGHPVRIADAFDLIGGTSTGAIIASGLALGFSATKLIDLYLTLGRLGFRSVPSLAGLLIPKFRTSPLMQQIRSQVGDITLGSEQLLTGLAIVTKRIDTGSTWVFHNNPNGRYFAPTERSHGAVPNRDIQLAQIIRASTAAPTFFAPERIEIARGLKGVFVDGAVSPHNNPALLLFMLATLKGYGFAWPMGAQNLSIVSLGTGHRPLTPEMMPPPGAPSAVLAVLALRSLIDDCSWLTQTMMQWLGTTPTPWPIDGEIGDLKNDQLGPAPALHYQRYTMELTQEWLRQTLNIDITAQEAAAFDRIDAPDQLPRLLEIGRRAAAVQVKESDFPAA